MSRDSHDRVRELLAERFESPLSAAAAAEVGAHLVGCSACRAVERDYTVQRDQLRTLGLIDPPRDLWARTRAAIDHEVAREGRRPSPAPTLELDRPPAGRQLHVALGSLVGVLVVLLLAAGPLLRAPAPDDVRPTPFSIPPQQLAFLDVADGELTLYRADVAEVCPPPRIDCAAAAESRPVVRLGGGVAAREVALGGNGQLFIGGLDALGGEVFAVVALPAQPAPVPSASPTARPGVSTPPTRGPDVSPSPTAAAPTPTPTGPVVEPSSDPTASPGRGPTASPADTPASGSAEPTISAPPTPGQPAAAEAHPILHGVRGTGAQAAWSPDGTILALSAMPADGSQGSDVYTWRPGEADATPLTSDHRSVFASWSGDRVVVSRTAPPSEEGTDAGFPTATTVVIDPSSGEERPVELGGAWLPSVDPLRHWVVFWQGRLETVEAEVMPTDGRLFIADWSAVDPWVVGSAAAGASPSPAPSDAAPVSSPGEPAASGAVPARPRPTATGEPETTRESETTTVASGGADEKPAPPDDPGASPSTSASASPTPEAPFVLATPLTVSGRTSDWVIRWSGAGTAYGIWTRSDGAAAGGGTLTVRSLPGTATPAGGTLVAPTPAQRSFALGVDRVAWVTPLPDGEGELWVASWGESGNGSLRLRTLDSAEALPAF